jgi:hypothetical protein
MLISYNIHGTICIQCGATGHVKRVQKLVVKLINPRLLPAQMGRGAALELLFAGREKGFSTAPTDYRKPFSISN